MITQATQLLLATERASNSTSMKQNQYEDNIEEECKHRKNPTTMSKQIVTAGGLAESDGEGT